MNSCENIESVLTRGMPVLLTNHHSLTGCFNHNSNILFFSDGTFENNALGILKGKKNYVFANLSKKNGQFNGDYDISYFSNGTHLKMTNSFYKEHNFVYDDAYGRMHCSSSLEFMSGNVNIESDLSEKFETVLTALRFAGDAIYFKLPLFYFTGTESVLHAVSDLINESINDSKVLKTKLFCDYKILKDSDINKYEDYDLIPGDYVFYEKGPIALVKICHNEAYIIPYEKNYSGELVEFIENAFNLDFVKKKFS
jgi:hypothetical protein